MTREDYLERVFSLQDENGCWNADYSHHYGPGLRYYVPNYKSTLWTLVLLADIETDSDDGRVRKPLKIIADHFWDSEHGIFTIGKSHFPIPCLNGNMLYLLNYFNAGEKSRVDSVVVFFSRYQRFDDGGFKTPGVFPYLGNRSCYGSHSCYWGVVKLLKGLSFLPEESRSESAQDLLGRCIEFVLSHEVCYSSHKPSEFLNPMISRLTFPNMYKSDFLEILWLLNREGIRSNRMKRASELLESKMQADGTWALERKVNDLIVPVTKRMLGNELITKRAREVTENNG